MGKEAIYRRLRGEVAFTFEEVSLISQHLGISLDKIVGRRMLNDTMFDLNLLHTGDPIESYYEILVRYAKLFDLLRELGPMTVEDLAQRHTGSSEEVASYL